MGSAVGVLKVAAGRVGVTVEEYERRRGAGEKWCTAHKAWHSLADFQQDRSRTDGLKASCRASARERYVPRARPAGRRYVDARDEDKRQARRRVNHLVDVGLLPNPNTVACTDCGHLGSDRRHEYDHHRGYAAEHHEDVEPVCSRCHHAREARRPQISSTGAAVL